MLKKTIRYLSQSKKLAVTNAFLIAAAVLMNCVLQAFCRPTLWAQVVLVICFGNTIIYPFLSRKAKLLYLSDLISGISFSVFVYCIIFLGHMNFLSILLCFGVVGFLTYIPHFFVAQLFVMYVYRPRRRYSLLVFLSGILMSLLVAGFFAWQYKKAAIEIEEFNRSGFTTLDQNFMTEKIMGMYFKYHTEICEYDGWRPPLHEPALVTGLWLNGGRDPLNAAFETRIELYKKFFPAQKIKEDCSCAGAYSSSYHNDSLFIKH